MAQVSEVVTYLLPSWAYTVSQPEAAKNIVDLLIFCEQPYCALLPPTCRQLVNNDGKLSFSLQHLLIPEMQPGPCRTQHFCICLLQAKTFTAHLPLPWVHLLTCKLSKPLANHEHEQAHEHEQSFPLQIDPPLPAKNRTATNVRFS